MEERTPNEFKTKSNYFPIEALPVAASKEKRRTLCLAYALLQSLEITIKLKLHTIATGLKEWKMGVKEITIGSLNLQI